VPYGIRLPKVAYDWPGKFFPDGTGEQVFNICVTSSCMRVIQCTHGLIVSMKCGPSFTNFEKKIVYDRVLHYTGAWNLFISRN
jgi:hypothetical protein